MYTPVLISIYNNMRKIIFFIGAEKNVQEQNIQLHQPAPTFTNDKVIVNNSENLTNGEK